MSRRCPDLKPNVECDGTFHYWSKDGVWFAHDCPRFVRPPRKDGS